MPTKSIKPVDSLYCIAAYIVDIAKSAQLTVDEIHERLNEAYPVNVTIENVILCLDFLYIIGKVELNNETINIKL